MTASVTVTAVDYEHTYSCQHRAKIHGDDACSCSARAMYVSRRLPIGRADHGSYHRAHAIHEIATVNGMDPAQGYTAALLGARILRAQRRETCPVCHVGIASCRCAASLDVSPAEWFQGQDLALAAYRAEHRERTA